MYLDDVVVAGIIILVLTCVFIGVVIWFAWRHIRQDIAITDAANGTAVTNHSGL